MKKAILSAIAVLMLSASMISAADAYYKYRPYGGGGWYKCDGRGNCY